MTRKVVPVLVACLAIAACGYKDRFEGDVRFKFTQVRSDGYELVLAQKHPVEVVSDW